MVHGNDVLHNNHFRKKWQFMVRTWFNQPARKERRRQARKAKSQRIVPRPASGPLHPIVNCPTFRYNMKVRAGKGFSLQEVRAAGLNPKFARTIGISVDHRRRNMSVEGLQRNVARLKAYKSRLILFPLNPSNLQPLEAKDPSAVTTLIAPYSTGTYFLRILGDGVAGPASQYWVEIVLSPTLETVLRDWIPVISQLCAIRLQGDIKVDDIKKATQLRGPVLPITQRCRRIKAHKPTDRELKYSAFHAVRQHRANARLYGKRLKARQSAAAE